MGRPSNREARRKAILQTFQRVVAARGISGATMALVADEAGIAQGLLHHHFRSKSEMVEALLDELIASFRARTEMRRGDVDHLHAYGDAALALDDRSDIVAARCWVALFAEAQSSAPLRRRLLRFVDGEVGAIERRSSYRLSHEDASAVLSFILGALLFGTIAPRKASGFAAPRLRSFVTMLEGGVDISDPAPSSS